MSKRIGWLCSLVLALILVSVPAHSQSTRDAYLGMKKSEFKKSFRHLAVLPLVSAPVLAMPDELIPVITTEVLNKLTKAKLTLVTPKQVQAIRDEFTALYPADKQQEHRAIIGDHLVREVFYRFLQCS